MLQFHSPECVCYCQNNLDTHRSFQIDGNYVIPVEGNYIYVTESGERIREMYKAGDTIHKPKFVMNDHCGLLGFALLKEIEVNGVPQQEEEQELIL